MENSVPAYPTNLPIAVDLFVSKKHPGLPHGVLGFADSTGKILFTVNRPSSKSSSTTKKLLLDSAGNPLISVCRHQGGSWEGFRGDDADNNLLFRVERTRNQFTRTELEVFLDGVNREDSSPDFKVRGCPFQKSCFIYRGDSIVAQTSLMYKLHQIYAGRSKFRVTLFPGSNDVDLLLALVVIFLDGRK
ncbi:hypothetical protein SLA2020_521250 [Shorea laevis]